MPNTDPNTDNVEPIPADINNESILRTFVPFFYQVQQPPVNDQTGQIKKFGKNNQSNPYGDSFIGFPNGNSVVMVRKEWGGVIGAGSFGKVKFVYPVSKDGVVGTKPQVVKVQEISPKEQNKMNLFFSECNITKYVYPPQEGSSYGFGYRSIPSKLKWKCYSQQPYLGENLTTFLEKNKSLTLEARFDLASKLMKILFDLHTKGVVHRDIKLDNILIDDEGNLHFCDFGLSAFLNQPLKISISGTTMYADPKVGALVLRYEEFRKQLSAVELQALTAHTYKNSDLFSCAKVLALIFGANETEMDADKDRQYDALYKKNQVAAVQACLRTPWIFDSVLRDVEGATPEIKTKLIELFKKIISPEGSSVLEVGAALKNIISPEGSSVLEVGAALKNIENPQKFTLFGGLVAAPSLSKNKSTGFQFNSSSKNTVDLPKPVFENIPIKEKENQNNSPEKKSTQGFFFNKPLPEKKAPTKIFSEKPIMPNVQPFSFEKKN